MNFNKVIKELCDKYSLSLETREEDHFRIFTDQASGIALFLKIENGKNLSFHFLQRTYDIIYQGDRSDAHVILSLMFASFLRQFSTGISCSLFDIPHPVINDEIWGRYIMPEQAPSFIGITSEAQIENAISKIISILVIWRDFFWQFAGCPCKECLKRDNINTTRECEIAEEINNCIKVIYKGASHANYGTRQRPHWDYIYDMRHEVTIIKSEELAKYIEAINNREIEKVKGINGELLLDGDLKNFIDYKVIKEFHKLMKFLSQKEINKINFIPLENMIIAAVNPYIIALGRLSGITEFKREREIIRERHNKESELLFPVALFEWNNKIDPDQFEILIKSLLERESNIKSVKRPAPVNQGDKSRDLIIEWYITNPNVISKTQPPVSLIRVVGQCKASKSTIGKSQVLDIRDTVETHNSNGFFLAVSTQISAPMTEKLESLRNNGIWTDWWNREDIELRLSKNQDLIPKFPKVIKAKHQVKFVEKE